MKIFNPIKSIRHFFAKKLKQKMEKKILEKRTTEHLQWLIDEYRLIQKKESKLSASERKKVIEQVEKYIETGHIVPK
jgi:hypothetical protein